MNRADIPFLSVGELSGLIQRKEISPVEATGAYLERIDDLDFRFNSYLTVCRNDAMEAAREAERAIVAGDYLGPMHGIPVGVKDIFYTAGVRTTACSKVYADFVPTYDATSVARFKEAGAIMLGKAVTPEFAYSDPSPAVHPCNAPHPPGCSSSSPAVALASRLRPTHGAGGERPG